MLRNEKYFISGPAFFQLSCRRHSTVIVVHISKDDVFLLTCFYLGLSFLQPFIQITSLQVNKEKLVIHMGTLGLTNA